MFNKRAILNFSNWMQDNKPVELVELTLPLYYLTKNNYKINDQLKIFESVTERNLDLDSESQGNLIIIKNGFGVPLVNPNWIVFGTFKIVNEKNSFNDSIDKIYTIESINKPDIDAICNKIANYQKCDFNTFRERYPDLLHIGEHEDEFKGIFE